MKTVWMLLMLSCTASIGVEGLYITRIVTEPSQGPFWIGRQILFSCQIEPAPPEPVTYQWRSVEHSYFGESASQQNFSRSHHYAISLHYCYYYCEVLMNGSLVGSASRIIELQGFLYTDEPLVRSFNCGESLVLNTNISDYYLARYITSIAWYHNGTKIVSGNKYIIENTTLRINNMAENDTGKYEVKINSISYNHYNNSPDCDSDVLPLLEALAAHAPVTFIVQKESGIAYEPSSIVSTHYVTDSIDDYNISTELRSASLNLSLFGSVSSDWYKNGTRISTGDSQELSLTYNNTATVIGDYVRLLWFNIYQWDSTLRGLCEGYYYYYSRFDFVGIGIFPLQVSFWSIKQYSPPSLVMLHFGKPILTGFETTTVECTAVGSEPVEAINLTLWRNGELLAHVNGSHLSHMTTPYQYGAYRCSVDSIHETAILMERVPFQLLLDGVNITNMECQQIQPVEDLRASVSALLQTLCQSCDGSNIVDVELNCSGSSMYVGADLVYSAPDGGITANTLINMLLTWMLSEDAPSIQFQGSAVRLNKQCPTQLNAITRHGCIAFFTSEALSIETTSITVMQVSGIPNFVVGFFTGLSAGVLVIAVIIVALTMCVLKVRRHAAKSSVTFEPSEADKSADIAMGTNQAYESVESRYQTGGGGCTQGGPQGEEVIYELPTV